MHFHQIKKIGLTIPMVLAILLPLQTHASGTGGYGSAPIQQRQVDRDYEHGKAIYNGRAGAGKKYAYCVELDGAKVPLKRKSLKSFKKGSAQAFANALYDCDRPDQKIGLEMPKDDFQYVMYYLNKRFRLKLASQSG